jgi:hypothetical protein
VQNQSHEAIDKILPRHGLLLQAALQQTPINLSEWHAFSPLITNDTPCGMVPQFALAKLPQHSKSAASSADGHALRRLKSSLDFRHVSAKKQGAFLPAN